MEGLISSIRKFIFFFLIINFMRVSTSLHFTLSNLSHDQSLKRFFFLENFLPFSSTESWYYNKILLIPLFAVLSKLSLLLSLLLLLLSLLLLSLLVSSLLSSLLSLVSLLSLLVSLLLSSLSSLLLSLISHLGVRKSSLFWWQPW